MRHAAILLALVAGYSSTGGGGYFRPSDGGAADLFGTTQEDLSSIDSTPDLAATQRDMARTVDFATSRPDLAKQFGCISDLNCYAKNNCVDATCFDNCDAMVTTPNGIDFLYAYLACIDNECPSSGGGVCDSSSANYSQANCQSCAQTAQSGVCATDAKNCSNDG